VFVGHIRARECLLTASFAVATTAEIDAVYEEARSRGATLQQRLTRQPWGAADFVVEDPDGNLIHFAGPAG
jgi:uncharacterized glyoxalase superfamily protein PhnB